MREIFVGWPPSRPDDWELCEQRIRERLLPRAKDTPYAGRTLAVLISRPEGISHDDPVWLCERVFTTDTDEDCPSAYERIVDEVLAKK